MTSGPAYRFRARRLRSSLVAAVLLSVAVLGAACSSAAPSASNNDHATTTQSDSGGHATTSTQSDSGGHVTTSTSQASGRNTTTTQGRAVSFPHTYATTPAPEIKTATVTISGQVCPVPRSTGGAPIDPYNDSGGSIIISDKGVLPYNLLPNIGQPIVWTNLTSSPVRVSLIGYPLTSPTIPPCGTFTHTFTTSYDFSYRTSNGHLGQVNVGAFQ